MSPLSVNHNLMAWGVSRQLSAHYDSLADSVRRLSTGLRVERAADDAAGLAIRELMRADIKALGQGARNANDAISMIQTADGALQIIDEKLIRMKELAEQAATGTYDSTQRLMIDSEFQQMASEIDRIAKATDFNGVKLLDGSLSGRHDGSGRGSEDGLSSTGALKVHFGTANDSAEDYYYLDIGDCTLAGLGLRDAKKNGRTGNSQNTSSQAGTSANTTKFIGEGSIEDSGMIKPPVNSWIPGQNETYLPMTDGYIGNIQDVIPTQGEWYLGLAHDFKGAGDIEPNFMFIIPAGTKNIVINQFGTRSGGNGDNDIQLFTKNGVHLAGTPLTDIVFDARIGGIWTDIDSNSAMLGFTMDDYDDSNLNTGPARWDSGNTLLYTQYNGMTIGYSGDGERQDSSPNDGIIDGPNDYEILTIDETTEDLIVWLPGIASSYFQYFVDYKPTAIDPALPTNDEDGNILSIATQELAQKALPRLDQAIVKKDTVRAHLGAMQNRLENTVTNLNVQAESLQAAESRISDVDVATEMTTFVRNQVLTQSATSMLAQANAFPHMLLQLLQE